MHLFREVSVMNKIELRKKEILNMLSHLETISVAEIAAHFSISIPTARRMCSALSKDGLVIRTHGGIKRIAKSVYEYSFDRLQNEKIDEKIRIAKYASTLVKNNQVIFLEAGTTLREFAIALSDRIRNGELKNIIIFTNSLINLNILYPVHKNIMMLGGQYRDDRKDFVGYLSELSLKGLQFDSCFIGADAISLQGGVMAMDIDTVMFDSALVKHSSDVIILANSDKFNKKSLISYISVEKVSSIITDTSLPHEIFFEYEKKGVNIIKV